MVRSFRAALAISIFLAPGFGQYSRPPAVPARYSDAFEAVWNTVNKNFYDPSFLGVNWADTGARYRAQLSNIHDDDQFKNLIDTMLRELPTSHLHFRVSVDSKTMTPATKIGVLTRNLGGEDVVVSVEPASDAAVQGLRPGDVLLAKEDSLRGPWGSSVPVEVRHCSRQIEKLMIRREPFGWPFERPSVQWKIVARSPGKRFAYVRITHFEDDFAPLVDKAMQEIAETNGMIVDLRNNTGGNASFVRLMSYLAPRPGMAFVLLSRPFLDRFGRAPETLDDTLLRQIPKVTGAYTTTAILDAFRKNGGGAGFYTEDLGKNYKGKVILLVNHETASAAEGFARDIQGWPGVTIVGQNTAGAVVGAEDFEISGGWILTLPTHAAWGPDGTSYRDQATTPDIVIPETRESLCRGVDAVLDAAIGILLR